METYSEKKTMVELSGSERILTTYMYWPFLTQDKSVSDTVTNRATASL